ncbi:MAG: anthranilate phosphoribosyltransferase [Desulfarculus sp.]|nr:anthranilate phosphoribosyltransferase [Desulfarculus sp.]
MIQEAIAKAVGGAHLGEEEMAAVMDQVMEGQATPAQIGALLIALRMKGETVEEIAGAARVMRQKCKPVPCRCGLQEVLVDTCGTGGDGAHTFNVSTTAAFVVAGAGARVAKHGNRSVSSRCGSADLMEALGIPLDLTPEQVGACVDEVGIGFLFAPLLHQAMRHAIGPRREIGLRTIFNLLGPLTNPAGATAQVLGVYDPALVTPLARVLGRLGCRQALVVHGPGGLDEISSTGPTQAAHLKDGQVSGLTITPEELGLRRAMPQELTGGDAAQNAGIALAVLAGEPGACRDTVLMNAGAALMVAGRAADLAEGLKQAAAAIDSGAALAKLDALRQAARLAAGQEGRA